MNFLNKFKYARDSYIVTFLVIAIIIMVNYIAAQHFIRADLTKNKIYAISDAGKTIMQSLNDIVTVKVFFSEKLPPDLFAVQQYVEDTLDELSSYSKGNLSVRAMNPALPEAEKEALALGIPQIQMNIVEKDKLEVKNGFLGIAVTYGGKTEIMPVVQSILNVEYDIISAVKKVTAQKTPVIGFVEGHNEPKLTPVIISGQQEDSFSLFNKSLGKNYKVVSVNIQKGDILNNIDTLLIAGSKDAFTENEKKAVDQFIVNGGNLVVFLDSVNIDINLITSSSKTDIEKLLSNYGIEIEKKLALDTSNERATFNQGYMNFIMPYPFWVKAVNKYFDKRSPMVSNINSVVFPWVSPLKVSKKENIKSTALISTTPKAWIQEEPFSLSPNVSQTSDPGSKYPLAILLEGKFSSFFGQKNEGNKNSRILVVGNSRFITDRFVNLYSQNLTFAMNAVDFLTLDNSLISIRSKTSFDLSLKDLGLRERNIIKFTGILLMPILVVVYGILRFLSGKRRKAIF